MSHPASPPDPDQPAPAAESPPDPAVLRAEDRLRVLQELREIGMKLARALERRVVAEDEAAPVKTAEAGAAEPAARGASGRDPAVAFAQLSRAIRLTLALEAKTDEELRGLESGIVREREEKRAKADLRAKVAAAEWNSDREERIQGLIMDAAEANLPADTDFDVLERELEERLLEDEDFWGDPQRPMRDVVERLCKYFSVTPDWSRWDGEGWARREDPPLWPWAPAPEAETGDAASPPTLNGAPALAAAHALE